MIFAFHEAKQEDKGAPLPHRHRTLRRLTQRGVRFIRRLRNRVFLKASWQAALDSPRRIYDAA